MSELNLTPQQVANLLLITDQLERHMDPMSSVEVAVEQRLVGLYSATSVLKRMAKEPEGREIIARPKCLEDLELVRDQLSMIIDDLVGK